MLAPKSDFIGLEDGRVHLATGGQPPLLKAHRSAFEAYAADKAAGAAGCRSRSGWRP
jgi:cysteine desulfurase / selenocysteine lyase